MDPRFIKLYFKSIKRRGKGETKKEEKKMVMIVVPSQKQMFQLIQSVQKQNNRIKTII